MNQTTVEKVIQWNPIFREVNTCKKRYRILKGSAGSGKSVNTAQDYIKKLSDVKYIGANLLVVRKVDETNRDSTFAELESAIYHIFGDQALRAWRISRNPQRMECVTTGSQIIFRGMNDASQREKVKSITFTKGKLTWIWVEEATEITEADLDILDDRLRGRLENPNLYYQMTLTFNPVAATHWIKSKFFDIKHPDILAHHSTYLDNRFIDDAYHRRMMMRKERDPDGYKIYGLGEWGETGGLILTNWVVEDFDTTPSRFDWYRYGQDFGYNHANAILSGGGKDGELYICNELVLYENDTAQIIEKAIKHGLQRHRIKMWCDSAEPDRIKMWKDAGFNAEGVKKNPGSINGQIDILKGFPKIHVHPTCIHTAREMGQWKYKLDRVSNKFTEDPVEFFDDAMAAMRYMIEDIRQKNRTKAVVRDGRNMGI